MALGTVSVCLTVLVLNLHHRDVERPVPRWMRILFLKYLATIICVPARKPKTMAGNFLLDHVGEAKSGSINLKSGLRRIARDAGLLRPMLTGTNGEVPRSSPQREMETRYSDSVFPPKAEAKMDKTHEWKEIAHVLDRLFFWIVFIFMSASALIILLVPLYKERFVGDLAHNSL
jgi:nicotinic acetylcholine receptor alpha-9/nicotinic acetylcholine receptor